MLLNFDVHTDNRGRILGFSPEGSPELTPPLEMGEAHGGQRLTHKGDEYALDAHGNLIHPGVEVPKGVKLGHGILLGEGVEFIEDGGTADETHEFDIEDHVLMPGGTQVHSGFHLAHHSIIRARLFGRESSTGAYTRILEESTVGPNVDIGSSVRLGVGVSVGAGVTIGDNVYISGHGVVDPGVTIGRNCKIKASHSNSLAKGISVHIREDMPEKTPLPNFKRNH